MSNNFNLEPFKRKLLQAKKNNSNITKSDIMEVMAEIITDVPSKVVYTGSKIVFDILEDNIVLGYRIEIRGFGSWSIRYLPPRNAHNPRSGEKVTTLGKFRPHFKAGVGLKNRINKTTEKEQQSFLDDIKNNLFEEEIA